MEHNFKTKCDEIDDHLEIGEILMRIRTQLTECSHNDLDMSQAPEVLKLIEFNISNRPKLEDIEK
jgi:hypothetical protein